MQLRKEATYPQEIWRYYHFPRWRHIGILIQDETACKTKHQNLKLDWQIGMQSKLLKKVIQFGHVVFSQLQEH